MWAVATFSNLQFIGIVIMMRYTEATNCNHATVHVIGPTL